MLTNHSLFTYVLLICHKNVNFVVGFQKKVIDILDTIKKQNEEILNSFRDFKQQSKPTTIQTCLPENIPVQFPIKNNKDIDNLELFLREKPNLKSLVGNDFIALSLLSHRVGQPKL